MSFGIEWRGVDELSAKLLQKSETDFTEVGRKNIRDIYTRSQKNAYQSGMVPTDGGTPVDSNELRMSAKYRDDEMGYSAEHGPHVEYGHRLPNGGFVPGQYFLKKNVDAQRPIYKQDLINKLKE